MAGILLPWSHFVIGVILYVASFGLKIYGTEDWYLSTYFQAGWLDDDHFIAFFFGIILFPFAIIFTLSGAQRIVTHKSYSITIRCVLLFLFSIIFLVPSIIMFEELNGNIILEW